MTQVKTENITPGWRGYLFEGAAIVFILLAAGISANLVATVLEGHFAHACAVDLQRGLQ